MTPPASFLFGSVRRWPALAAAALLTSTLALPQAQAQVPGVVVAHASYGYSAQELENLVGPIALYPDDLVALVLPASTQPLQLVQAERFLAQRASNPQLAVDERWDDAVKALLNYPDVVALMSHNIDWVVDLGEAVAVDAEAVLDAVQTFRRRTHSVGHLRSDDKQVVVLEREIIKIVPANPEVIYVPQYNPDTVVMSGPSAWTYHPQPYPVYHYPYAAGSSFAAGLVWGAAVSSLWRGSHYQPAWGPGGRHHIHVNQAPTNVARPGRPPSAASVWKPRPRPEKIGHEVSRPRPPAAVSRPAVAPHRPGDKAAAQPPARQPPALSGVERSSREALRDSARGAASRRAAQQDAAPPPARPGSEGPRGRLSERPGR